VRRLGPVGDIEEMTVMEGLYVVRWLLVVATVCLLAEMFVFERVGVGGVVSLPTRVKLVELMGRVWRWAKEGCKEGL